MDTKNRALARDYGVDLLRILCMGMIVVIYMLMYGMNARSIAPGAGNYAPAWMLLALSYPAVNAYAIISGYVGLHSRGRLSGLLNLWCQVFFYSVGLTLLVAAVFPGSLTVKKILQSFLPVSMDVYWYFTIYAALFFLMPGLNYAAANLDINKLKGVTLGALVMLSVLPTVSGRDLFKLESGYHVAWLTALYLTGGCIRRVGLPEKRPVALWLGVYLGAVALEWGTQLAQGYFGLDYYHNLMRYDSPAPVIGAVALLMLFAGRKFPGWAVKAVSWASPLAFGVYLIHDHPSIRGTLVIGALEGLRGKHPAVMALGILGAAVCVFSLCLAIDALRRQLFQAVGIHKLCAWAEEKVSGIGEKLKTG